MADKLGHTVSSDWLKIKYGRRTTPTPGMRIVKRIALRMSRICMGFRPAGLLSKPCFL
jgi:hypothetical protein